MYLCCCEEKVLNKSHEYKIYFLIALGYCDRARNLGNQTILPAAMQNRQINYRR